MVDQPLLSDLCSICNNNSPKYCCPRCSTRTCSLPCYKRHQQWAQCSGQRDPAAYRKKSDLATPAAINRDYNFLTGIERAFDKADRHAEEKGIGIRDGESREPAPGSNYHKYLQEMRVIIKRAPKGMSRQRANATKWHKNEKCIHWTVEWIHEDQSRDIVQVPDSKPLSKAHSDLIARKQGTSKKRKRGQNAVERPAKDGAVLPFDPPRPSDIRDRVGQPTEAIAHHLDPAAQALHATRCGTNPDAIVHVSGSLFEAKGDTQQRPPKQSLGPDDPATTDGKADASGPPTGKTDSHDQPNKELYFYLVKPYTSTSRRVLIPVPSAQCLLECLRDQIVLEFPTIQVLSNPPSSLPDGFMLEQAYLDQSREEEHELNDLLATVARPTQPDSEAEEYARRVEEEEFNDHRILEVLRQDVGVKR